MADAKYDAAVATWMACSDTCQRADATVASLTTQRANEAQVLADITAQLTAAQARAATAHANCDAAAVAAKVEAQRVAAAP